MTLKECEMQLILLGFTNYKHFFQKKNRQVYLYSEGVSGYICKSRLIGKDLPQFYRWVHHHSYNDLFRRLESYND